MLALLLAATLQTQAPDSFADRLASPSGTTTTSGANGGAATGGSMSGTAPGAADRDHPRGREETPPAARPVDDRFATDPNAPPRPTRRVTIPNPHDAEPANSNPHR